MSQPDYNTYLGLAWGWPDDFSGCGFGAGSNVVIGSNPSFTINQFLTFHPKFGGIPNFGTISTTENSAVIVLTAAVANIAVGQLVNAAGIPDATVIASISGLNITLSQAATATATGVSIAFFVAPFVPLAVLNAYIFLASASLVFQRWFEMWPMAMGLYVAHFATLWLQSDGNPATTAAAAAQQGLATGIKTSKSVGDVSVGYTPVGGLEDWAAWNLTEYGQQLATFAKIVGMGSMYLQ